MSGESEEAPSPSAPAGPRWWSTEYAVRLGVALAIASVIVGGVLGPANLLFNRLETAWAGGELWYPDWMYWQAALIQITLGGVVAGGASFASVLLRPRPKAGAVLRRLMVGPMIAGLLLAIVSVLYSGAGMERAIVMTFLACLVFVGAGMLFRLTKVDPVPVEETPRMA